MITLVKPFAALRPEPEHAAAVIAPPYDVVSEQEARDLAAGHANSFLRISRPEIDLPPGTDPHSEAVYAKGAENLERLTALGLLTREATPSYYAYRMKMAEHEQTGIALTASVAAYDANLVRKHERTRPHKETDRVRNIDSLNAQTGPVLSVFRADATINKILEEVKHSPPLLDVTGQYDVVHTLWRIDQPAAIEKISTAFQELGVIYIADGHHRSAAASRVAADRAAADGTKSDHADLLANYNFFLSVAFPDNEMNILDYNRVVRDLNGLSAQQLTKGLAENFDVELSNAAVKPERPGTFGMYLGGQWYRLSIRADRIPTDDPVGRLDVSLLQDWILAPLLGVGDPRLDPRVDFVGGIRGLAGLSTKVDSGDVAVAFSLYPTSMEQLMAVADAEQLMPPKSTWFEPKLADGLLTHVLD
jgi:uncharacterized protein (DUF1015 family)